MTLLQEFLAAFQKPLLKLFTDSFFNESVHLNLSPAKEAANLYLIVKIIVSIKYYIIEQGVHHQILVIYYVAIVT